ncbi:MAG: DNA gyrase subunit A [archaeon]|nr:DNA gyrase subunit A [archaeon]
MTNNESNTDNPIKNTLTIRPIETEMSRSYIDYSMSVIIGRALPDARDGLKPVHRRILYAMNELGVPYNRPYKKSARIVGEVLGKYHPHGDVAAYDAMVRLAQPFSLRYPLVDGQGNFGSVDGDPAAAMRYTEARLTKLSADLLEDIDKDTVNFTDNFDGSLKEPVVLPSKFPNLLVNGSSGIAVGMATNMPPHNISEVIDAIAHVIDNPTAETINLMQFIKGPDFPTGGVVHGIGGILDAYNTGRGKIKIRSKTHFERKSERTTIVVDEIPYQVNKEKLIMQIADCVKNKEILGVTNINDESDKDGMRIVIEIHKDAIESVILENLFKHTQMEVTFGIINLALVNNKPVLLTLKELIKQYIAHRKEVVTRRTKYDLTIAKKRYHTLEGFIAAINNMDSTIDFIRASENTDEASEKLQSFLTIDADQAKSILDLKLQKLTGFEIGNIIEEYNNLKKSMIDLQDILDNEERIYAIIKEELKVMKDNYGDNRRTIIDSSEITSNEEDLIPRKDIVITLTNDNYIKSIPLETYKQQRRGGVGLIGMRTKEDDNVANMLVSFTHDYVMFITNTGRMYRIKGYQIPESSRQSKGKPIVNIIPKLGDGEKVVSIISTKEFLCDRSLIFCTKKGIVKKTILSAYGNVRSQGIRAIKLDPEDSLIGIGIARKNSEILVASKNGLAARFDESEIRSSGRSTIGVKGMTLNDGDTVVGMEVVTPKDIILTISENGFGKITTVHNYRKTHRGSKGVITIKTTGRNGSVAAIKKVQTTDELIITSKQGKIIRIEVSDMHVIGRNTAGVRLMRMHNDDKITAVQSIQAQIK